MKSFTLITALSLCSFISGSECQAVEVQAGGEVTLLCSNFSSSLSQILWFRVVNRSQPRDIAFIFEPHEPAKFSDGFRNGKFEMKSNISIVFLTIKQVNTSDSGLYFCGFYMSRKPVIVQATYLEVQAFDGMTKLASLILAGLTALLLSIIIALAVKVKKLQKALAEEQNPQRTKNRSSDELNYATVTFHPKTKRNHRPAPKKEEETDAIYAATR